ncbi:hypothetical protein L1049_023191 [Liquidambar formosana]|uniref:Uncharacterized protein n=1 Tax=Liquidambar formosana TaxID=63359 RepID=A0AAP0WPM9_LIQFO
MHNSLVTELEDDGHDVVTVLSANKPSILLFVDRSSDSSATREKSKVALDAFRELALNYQTSHHMGGQNNDKPAKSSVQSFQAFKSTSEHHRLELSPTSQKIEVKDKTSIMIINEGKHVSLDNVASDLHGTSLHEILAYFLQHKKEAKLSSLAKESGFQLLSDDFDVKIEDTLPSQTEVQSNQVSPGLPMEGLVRSSDNLNKDRPYIASISALEKEEISRPT